MNGKSRDRKVFMQAERVAVAELLELAALCATSPKRAIKAMGALCIQRAENIIDRKAFPLMFSNSDMVQFVTALNEPKPKRRAKR